MRDQLDYVRIITPGRHGADALRSLSRTLLMDGELLVHAAGQAERAHQGKGLFAVDGRALSFLAAVTEPWGHDGVFDEQARRRVERMVERAQPAGRDLLLGTDIQEAPAQLHVPAGSLIVIAGIPGSGKSTLASAQRSTKIDVVDLDKFIAHGTGKIDINSAYRQALHQAHELLQAKRTVIWESTFVHFAARWSLLSLAQQYDCPVHVVVLPCDFQESAQRIAYRAAEGGHNVPRDAIKSYTRRWPRAMAVASLEGFDYMWHARDDLQIIPSS